MSPSVIPLIVEYKTLSPDSDGASIRQGRLLERGIEYKLTHLLDKRRLFDRGR